MAGRVVSVSWSGQHAFRKERVERVRLLAGLGVEGDAHCGAQVMHRYDRIKDPTRANLRQVHLVQAELFAELAAEGFEVAAGELGENVTTVGLDLLGLPTGTRLRLGPEAVVELTGLRSPCGQIDGFQEGLRKAVKGDGSPKAGVMGVVIAGGEVAVGDGIEVEMPAEPWRAMECV